MLRDVEASLVTHVGGNPSAAEAILIRAAALKVVRLNLLADKMMEGEEVAGDAHGVLAWSNGLRRDLEVLGLRPRARDAMEDLTSYLAGRPA